MSAEGTPRPRIIFGGSTENIMPRLKKEKEVGEGWSRWIPPTMTKYRLGCCDCGLVHDMEFAVVKVTARKPDGTWLHGEPLGDEYHVLFRARRNNRSTAGTRRCRHNNQLSDAHKETQPHV